MLTHDFVNFIEKTAFYFRRDLGATLAGIEDRETDTGQMKVASVELTALDMVRYPRAAGGINHIATVSSDLGKRSTLASSQVWCHASSLHQCSAAPAGAMPVSTIKPRAHARG
jgi:hypothetical protein